jgi:hypothetical protein
MESDAVLVRGLRRSEPLDVSPDRPATPVAAFTLVP